MKKALVILFALWLGNQNLQAQETPKTLFGDQLPKVGFMVDPGFQYAQVAGEGTGFFLFRGGFVFNEKLTIGGFYGTLLNDIRPQSFENVLPPRAHLDSYQAGGFIEYTMFSSNMVHLTFPLAIGIMELEVDGEGRGYDYEETKTLFIEPGAQVEVNLHRFAKLHAGLGYRIMGGTIQNFPDVPEAGNSLTFQIGLKMGVFNFHNLKNK
jgi:hypothetical protein